MKKKSNQMPSLANDAEAEKFVDSADLSRYDLSGFKPMHFEIEPKAAALKPVADVVLKRQRCMTKFHN